MMTLSIRPLNPEFAGEVSDVDITRPLSRDEVDAIEAGMDRYAVLVFSGQHLSDDAQRAFTRNFGLLESSPGGHIATAAERRLPLDMQDASNLDKDQKPLARDDRRRMFNLGNRLWHSDSSYRAMPAKYSLLSGRIVVERGGRTEFADMRAAYDALDAATKAEIEDLICEHSLMFSRGTLGFTELSDAEREMFRPVRQRLVRTHPVSGRGSLFLSAHAGTDCRLAGAGGARLPARPGGARNAASVRVFSQVAAVGPGDVGQPPDHAPCDPVRRNAGARHAPHHCHRRRNDSGAGRLTLASGNPERCPYMSAVLAWRVCRSFRVRTTVIATDYPGAVSRQA